MPPTSGPAGLAKYLRFGAGPRAGQYLLLGAKARAVLEGRTHATAADVDAVAAPVLRHRIGLNFAARSDGVDADPPRDGADRRRAGRPGERPAGGRGAPLKRGRDRDDAGEAPLPLASLATRPMPTSTANETMTDDAETRDDEAAGGSSDRSGDALTKLREKAQEPSYLSRLRDQRTHAILGAATTVHQSLGPGFRPEVYREALAIEFEGHAIPFIAEPELPIRYRGRTLGASHRAAFLCHQRILLEVKAEARTHASAESHVLNYLKATGFPLGLALNFGAERFEYRMLINATESR